MLKTPILILALVIRCILVCVGVYVNDPPALSMTDIDYLVVWDGICLASVPSERTTYRYSPMLKLLLWPICSWPIYGKLLYIMFDIVFGLIAYKITGYNNRITFLWLLNPIIIALSVRGSFDTVVQVLLAYMLLTIKQSKHFTAGLILGLCIHLRIYPIIFCPFISLYVILDRRLVETCYTAGVTRVVSFLSAVVVSLTATTVLSISMDSGYLSSGLLYHIFGRVDHRHNLSILWGTQLACSKGKEAFCWPFAKIFQITILAALIIRRVLTLRVLVLNSNKQDLSIYQSNYLYHQLLNDLDDACRSFVAFNSVVTAQYFAWTFATSTLSSNTTIDKLFWFKSAIFFVSLGLSLGASASLEFFGNTNHLSIITLANVATMGSLLLL